jgi:predicted nuclease of predicted toxin-antitoxin system
MAFFSERINEKCSELELKIRNHMNISYKISNIRQNMSEMNELFEHNFKTFSNNEKFIATKDQDLIRVKYLFGNKVLKIKHKNLIISYLSAFGLNVGIKLIRNHFLNIILSFILLTNYINVTTRIAIKVSKLSSI